MGSMELIIFQWLMRRDHHCHQQCDAGFCPNGCGSEGFCYFLQDETENGQEMVPESLKKQSLLINSKHIQSNESKCFKPGYNRHLTYPSQYITLKCIMVFQRMTQR